MNSDIKPVVISLPPKEFDALAKEFKNLKTARLLCGEECSCNCKKSIN